MTVNGEESGVSELSDALRAYLSSLEDWLESLPLDLDELERLAAEMPARSPFHWPCGRAHSPDAKCVSVIDAPKWFGGLGGQLSLVRSNQGESSGMNGSPARSLGDTSNVVMFGDKKRVKGDYDMSNTESTQYETANNLATLKQDSTENSRT